MPRLHRVIDGIERFHTTHPPNSRTDTARPLTIDILIKFLSFLPPRTPENQLFRAILTIGTLTGLRPGELLANSHTDIGKAARWNQFSLLPNRFQPSYLVFELSQGSKTASFLNNQRVQTPNYAHPLPSAVLEMRS